MLPIHSSLGWPPRRRPGPQYQPYRTAPVARASNRPFAVIGGVLLASALAACGGGGTDGSAPVTGAPVLSQSGNAAPTVFALGKKLFNDPSLSASGKLACASCHAAEQGHASPFSTAVAMGGLALDKPGTRLAPTLRYLRYNTAFHFDAEGTPVGGFDWDGRAKTFAAQAERPLLSDNEMGNSSHADVVAKLVRSPYADDFKQVFGSDIYADPELTFERIAFALQSYQIDNPDFAPFTSKFDYMTAGKAAFTPQEQRGLAWFNRVDKGNCAACHTSTKPGNAPGALFTDFTFDNLGVPRNPDIAANRDPAYFDLGLCGPSRTDLKDKLDLCGAFKVPTLRNVGLRKRFFHNGAFDSLEQVVRFYVQRDTNPELWYPVDAAGNVDKFNDLPVSLRGNVNTTEVPYDRKRGDAPRLNESEVQDLVAFLRTLNDGWQP